MCKFQHSIIHQVSCTSPYVVPQPFSGPPQNGQGYTIIYARYWFYRSLAGSDTIMNDRIMCVRRDSPQNVDELHNNAFQQAFDSWSNKGVPVLVKVSLVRVMFIAQFLKISIPRP